MPTSPLPPDPYKVLGVAKDATIANIRSVYRKLVLTTHPDKFPDETIKAQKADEFHRVQQAYELLSDDKSRERYDSLVRLQELKAERLREEHSSPRTYEAPYRPRPTSERTYTTQPFYEEIRPTNPRFYEEPRPEPRQSPRFEEHYRRPRADYNSDYDDFVPAHGTSKKAGPTTRSTESRHDDGHSRAKSRWKAAATKVTEHSRARDHDDRRKSRDKGRRDDHQSKRSVNIPSDILSDTESEVEAFMKKPAGGSSRKSDRPRSYEEEKSRRRRYESRGSSPDAEERKMYTAAQHIINSRSTTGDRDSRRRPALSRGQSGSRKETVPPPPPIAPLPIVEDTIRASVRRGGLSRPSTKSKKELPEILEPRREKYDTESKRPHLAASVTSPSPIKPPRSATLDVRSSDRPKAQIRRSATSPLAPSVTSHSHKSSKLRDTHDSGYSSPGTPDPSKTTRTAYRVVPPSSDEDDAEVLKPHYVVLEPDTTKSSREPSPRFASYRSERSTSSRHGPSRSHTIDDSLPSRPATLGRSSTERPSRLFGEVSGSPESRDRAQYPNVRESPRYGKGDINYSTYLRRASPPETTRIDPRDHYRPQERRGSMPIRA